MILPRARAGRTWFISRTAGASAARRCWRVGWMPGLGGRRELGLPGVILLHSARAQNLAQERSPGATPRAFPRLAPTSHARNGHTHCVTWLLDALPLRLRTDH